MLNIQFITPVSSRTQGLTQKGSKNICLGKGINPGNFTIDWVLAIKTNDQDTDPNLSLSRK